MLFEQRNTTRKQKPLLAYYFQSQFDIILLLSYAGGITVKTIAISCQPFNSWYLHKPNIYKNVRNQQLNYFANYWTPSYHSGWFVVCFAICMKASSRILWGDSINSLSIFLNTPQQETSWNCYLRVHNSTNRTRVTLI